MTNEQVHELLKRAQQFWAKYKDNTPDPGDIPGLQQMMREAGTPLEGMPPPATPIMEIFAAEISERINAKEAHHA